MACSSPALFAAQSFSLNHYQRLIPVNKKVDPYWLENIFETGRPEPVSDPEAQRRISFPVGGQGCGTLYIRGDGMLWLWDVFGTGSPTVLEAETLWKDAILDRVGGST